MATTRQKKRTSREGDDEGGWEQLKNTRDELVVRGERGEKIEKSISTARR